MRKLCYKVVTVLFLVIFLFSGICWFYAEQILDQFIRPKIEKTATQLLEAPVEIKQLVWTEAGLKILGLNIKAPQQFLVTIPQVELEFTLSALWHRRLDALRMTEPQIEIFQIQSQGETPKTTLKIPDRLPLTIAKLRLADGRLLIHSSDRQWQLHKLNFSGTLQQNSAFRLSAFFGPDENYPLNIAGAVELSQQQTLTIENFSWQEQQLLTTPLQIALAGADFTLGRTILHLKHFDHNNLQEILIALGQPLLLPEAMTFSLADATLICALQDQAINLELQVTKGLIGWNELSGSLTQLKVAGKLARKAAARVGDITLTADEITLPDLTLNQFLASGKLGLSSDQLSLNETAISFTLASNDGLSSQVNIKGVGKFSPQKFSLTLQQLSLAPLNYMSVDGQTGVGEAEIKLQGNINGPWMDGPIALELNGTFAAQEILAGAFYADLSPYQGDFSLTGNVLPKREEISSAVVKINIPQLGVVTATGQLNSQGLSTQGHIEVVDLGTSYGKRIGPLLGELKPTMADLSLKGEISLDYNLHWNPAGWQTNGALQLKDVDASWEHQKLKVVAGNGSVPFSFSSGQAPVKAISDLKSTGKISFSTLSAGLATLEQRHLELVAAGNRFTFISPLRLQLADGHVAIENLNLKWPNGKPQGSAKINITDVNLETLTQELGLPVMQGQLSADLGTLHFADQQLSTEGLASIEVFDGLFQLRNMLYSAPFSRYPTFHTDIDFSGLDLLQATRTFDFGEINGVVDGHIYGLKLFGTTPAAFEAAIATQDKGKRNISVKALNNLSIISQGGMSAALSRGVYRFIDFYRYQKIGFKCALDNDTFTLLGTALSGSDRYLVHGGLLPPKIDITTTTPTISFKEMMNRLSRIDRAGN